MRLLVCGGEGGGNGHHPGGGASDAGTDPHFLPGFLSPEHM